MAADARSNGAIHEARAIFPLPLQENTLLSSPGVGLVPDGFKVLRLRSTDFVLDRVGCARRVLRRRECHHAPQMSSFPVNARLRSVGTPRDESMAEQSALVRSHPIARWVS